MKGMLSCTTLLTLVRDSFSKIKDTTQRKCTFSLVDCLMSGYALSRTIVSGGQRKPGAAGTS